MSEPPALSVIVTISSDTISQRAEVSHLDGCLQALSEQKNPPTMEIIVPHHPEVDGIEELSERYPQVHFQVIPEVSIADRRGGGREHHDTLKAYGLKIATGDIIALLEDYSRPDPTWAAKIIQAHRSSPAAIGGAIQNGIDKALNWAVYFHDFGRYQNPLPAGPTTASSDINTSYKREALDGIRPLWQDSFREIVVNGGLIKKGEELVLDPAIVVHHHRSDLDLSFALKERFIWGRSYAVTRSKLIGTGKRYAYAVLTIGLPMLLLGRMAHTAQIRGNHIADFIRAVPYLVPLLYSWSIGEMIGYIAPSRMPE